MPPCLFSDKHTWGYNGPAVRLGLRRIKGLQAAHADMLTTIRKRTGHFTSIEQFHHLTRLPVATLKRLAEADAFSSLNLSRRQALWQVMELSDNDVPLFTIGEGSGFRVQGSGTEDDSALLPEPRTLNPEPLLPTKPLGQEVMTDYCTTGHSLKSHPLALVRSDLTQRRIIPAKQVYETNNNTWVKVAGLVLIRQRPGTASGIVFITLEDETGIVNLIVKPDIYERFRPAARYAGLLQADGYLQRQGQVVHVIVKRMFDLSHLLAGYQFSSRDFH